ncbi:MAG: hypothetical protein HZR80_16565 [Candidatus Heimdallarchaeota archaeon]
MNYKRALTRKPGPSFDRCISDHPLKKYLNIGQARRQHEIYCNTLTELGLEVITLPHEDNYPDACFVEDTVVVHGNKAFFTRMAKESRQGEETAIIEVLENHFRIKTATAPATVEGGDVIHLDDRLICGLTQRTNLEGIKQMNRFLGVPIDTIDAPHVMHLKSHITYLSRNTIAVTEAFSNLAVLQNFNHVIIPSFEKYAANTLTINDVILMPKMYPKSQDRVREAGFEVIPIDTSEFEKCGGALTCLSILF